MALARRQPSFHDREVIGSEGGRRDAALAERLQRRVGVPDIRVADGHLRAVAADPVEFLHDAREQPGRWGELVQQVQHRDFIGGVGLERPWELPEVPHDVRGDGGLAVDVDPPEAVVAAAAEIVLHLRAVRSRPPSTMPGNAGPGLASGEPRPHKLRPRQ